MPPPISRKLGLVYTHITGEWNKNLDLESSTYWMGSLPLLGGAERASPLDGKYERLAL